MADARTPSKAVWCSSKLPSNTRYVLKNGVVHALTQTQGRARRNHYLDVMRKLELIRQSMHIISALSLSKNVYHAVKSSMQPQRSLIEQSHELELRSIKELFLSITSSLSSPMRQQPGSKAWRTSSSNRCQQPPWSRPR